MEQSSKLKLNNKFRRFNHKWSEFMDQTLMFIVTNFTKKNIWFFCEKMTSIPGLECKNRYLYLTKRLRERAPFSEKEDATIRELHAKYGPKWSKIAKELKTRTRKQVRERYINKLDDQKLQAPFTEEEDFKIFQLFRKYGNKWSFISKFFPDRTTDKVRIRFHSNVKRHLQYFSSKLSKIKNNASIQ